MEKRRTVRVACSQMNGLMLQLYTRARDELGVTQALRDGPAVRLNGPSGAMGGTNQNPDEWPPGITELDGEWWDRWVEQNKGKNPLLDGGVIREWQENPTS